MNAQRAAELVTPVVLTFNEEPNIERTLSSVQWAHQAVVVDSGSSDATERIARSFPNVQWHTRQFDTHANQWRYAVGLAPTRFVLALDADYQVPTTFVDELGARFGAGDYVGGIAGFAYAIRGQELSGTVYPAKLVVFRPDLVKISQPGHTQEMAIDGPLYHFSAKLIHDDRKPLSRFVSSQMEYSRLEALRLGRNGTHRWQDRIRRLGLMPLIAGVGAYVKSGGPFKGAASLHYAYERALFECLLALRVLNPDEKAQNDTDRKR